MQNKVDDWITTIIYQAANQHFLLTPVKLAYHVQRARSEMKLSGSP